MHDSRPGRVRKVSYRRIDGTPIAADWAGLTSETYTGTSCPDFTSNSPGPPYAYVGVSNRSASDWTTVYLQFCDPSQHLYCFDQ